VSILQIDIVFPSSDSLENTLSNLGTQFAKGKLALSDLYEQLVNRSTLAHQEKFVLLLRIVNESINFYVYKRDSETLYYLSTDETNDKWCIDPRAVLTLCVTKDTYQRLGLVGDKIPFKGCAEQYGTSCPSSRGFLPSTSSSDPFFKFK